MAEVTCAGLRLMPLLYYTGPLASYYGLEVLDGQLRAAVPAGLFLVCCDKSGHDPGDEDRT